MYKAKIKIEYSPTTMKHLCEDGYSVFRSENLPDTIIVYAYTPSQAEEIKKAYRPYVIN